MPLWEGMVLLIGGVVSLITGLYLRFAPPSTRVRRTYRVYHNMNAPRYIRNSHLVLIPLGVAGSLFGIGAMLIAGGGRWGNVGGVLALVAFLVFLTALVLVHYPPAWLKPAWLREEERPEQSQLKE